MTWLVTSDLHLTDRPRDGHRFGLFPWLAKQQKKYDVSATIICGDITDSKDKHSASLVNQLVDGLTELRPPVYILKGNHDFIDPNNPFFGFLSCIDGIQFVSDPVYAEGAAMIPHQPDQAALDQAFHVVGQDYLNPELFFCHQLFTGAIAESNGRALTGLAWSPTSLSGAAARGAKVYAGDIHKPQQLDCGVTYIGAPWHCRFGDDYVPRVLLLKGGKEIDLHYPAPRKWSVTIRDVYDLDKHPEIAQGDQIKLTIEIAREEIVEWSSIKQRVLETCKGLEIFGVEMKVLTNKLREHKAETIKVKSNENIFTEFCKGEGVASNIKKAGRELLD